MPRSTTRYATAYVIKGTISVLGTLAYPLLSQLLSVADGGRARWGVGIVSALVALSMMAGALLIERMPTLSRVMLTVSLAVICVVAVGASGFGPMTVFTAGLLFSAAAMWVWYSRSVQRSLVRRIDFDPVVLEIRAACVAGLMVWVYHMGAGLSGRLDCRISLLAAYLVVLLFLQKILWRRGSAALRVPRAWVLVAVAGFIAASVLTWRMPAVSVTWLLGIPAAGLIVLRHSTAYLTPGVSTWWEDLFAEPYRLLFVSFLGTALVGGFVLAMPVSSASGTSIGLLDALFTSVSATCVTGLVVLDTAGDFSAFGQVVILVLIQVGGLGIMTFSVAAILLLGQRLSLRYEGTMSAVIGEKSVLSAAIRRLVGVTLIAELVGAGLLFLLFRTGGDTIGDAVFRGVFTSISAYCNAGFAIQSDNLVTYQGSPAVLHVVALLIIVGGLGPYVTASLFGRLFGGRLLLQPRVVLVTTLVLLVVPAVLITVVEWSNTLAGMPLWDKLSNGWFQAVTPRTAGFNSVDIASMHPVSLALIKALMFVGGSPGSTAGGVKTTTLAIMVLAVIAALRGRSEVTVFGRRVAARSVVKATAVVVVAVFAVFLVLIALLLTQTLSFDVALFEAMSALATVGLSTGGTASLDEIGKVIILLAMFAGRLGPLTLFLLLGADSGLEKWQLPEEEIHTG
jgi:trk system potassium uptake protein TrkH